MKIFYINAFAEKLFCGNPAAVCVLNEPLSEETLQAIAFENNLPATVFLSPQQTGFAIRWFTPLESNLCGHGTLAAAYVVFHQLKPELEFVEFSSKAGPLRVRRDQNFITMDLPAKVIARCAISSLFQQALPPMPEEVFTAPDRCVVVLSNEHQLRNFKPNLSSLQALGCDGIVVTAPGDTVDFVSRTFYPHKSIFEDPVTGASHCLLAPYWAIRLGKSKLEACQLSMRGGYLRCEVQKDRVFISGKAVLYMQGTIVMSNVLSSAP